MLWPDPEHPHSFANPSLYANEAIVYMENIAQDNIHHVEKKCHSLCKFHSNDKHDKCNDRNATQALVWFCRDITVEFMSEKYEASNTSVECMFGHFLGYLLLLYENSSYPVAFWVGYANYCTNTSEMFLLFSFLFLMISDVIQS